MLEVVGCLEKDFTKLALSSTQLVHLLHPLYEVFHSFPSMILWVGGPL